MTAQGYTHIAVLLDRSGSMAEIKDDTEGGYNTFLSDQKAQPGRATLSLAQFDTVYQIVHAPKDIALADKLKLKPRGGTALLDGMGRFITETGEWLASLDENQRPSSVLFVTITDGQENSSKEWTRERVFKLVQEQTDTWGWTFAFLAANQDAIATGHAVGVAQANSMNYTAQNVGATYATLSRSTSQLRGGGQFNLPDNPEE